ncbi:MAG: hypothetical protein NTV86_07500 [Planctomycetota bacterium]|nr:hypothetical protein [Planctomycetota bacterium]
MPKMKLANVSLLQLKAELARRQKALPKLARQRAKLLKALAAVEAEMAQVAGAEGPVRVARVAKAAPAGRKHRTGRPPRPGSLKAIILAAMGPKKALSVPEAVQAAIDGGYKSQSKNFRLLVNQTLLNEPEFRKVSRGKYAAR